MSGLTHGQLLERLEPIRSALGADGYDLHVEGPTSGRVTARIVATADACPDCLVPKTVMASLFTQAISGGDAPGTVEIDLVYPADV